MKDIQKIKRERRLRRHKRKRAKISGTKERPRLSVFRSNVHIYCQLIDDEEGKTLFAANDFELKENEKSKTKKEKAFLVGKLIAQKAQKAGIKKVVFDTGGFKYHGRVKALAEGAREGGLIF